MKDYYQILDIIENASAKNIKKSYHKLAHKYHPDRGGCEQKFKEINEAYQILSNKEKKEQYDRCSYSFKSKKNSTDFESKYKSTKKYPIINWILHHFWDILFFLFYTYVFLVCSLEP